MSENQISALCPHCRHGFEAQKYGLVDCPQCGKPVFIKRPAPEPLVEDAAHAEEGVDIAPAPDASAASVTGEPWSGTPQQRVEEPSFDPALDDLPTGPARYAEPDETPPSNVEGASPAPSAVDPSAEPSTENPPPSAADGAKPFVPSWEDTLPFLPRLLRTIRAVLAKPQNFFEQLPDGEGRKAASYGYLICSWAIVSYSFILYLQFAFPSKNFKEHVAVFMENSAITFDQYRVLAMVFIVLGPLFAVLAMHLLALSLHFATVMMGVPELSYHRTFRLVAYGLTPLIISGPFIMVGLLGVVYFLTIGFVRMYKVSYGFAGGLVLLVSIFSFIIFVSVATLIAFNVAMAIGLQ